MTATEYAALTDQYYTLRQKRTTIEKAITSSTNACTQMQLRQNFREVVNEMETIMESIIHFKDQVK